jgi:nitroreductase
MTAPGNHSETSTVRLTSGLPETVLPLEPEALRAALAAALAQPVERRRQAVSDVVRTDPRSLDAWAALGALARDDVEAYAYFRVGYHRGLDALRGSGWKGSGLVRWSHDENRGFLRCLDGLRSTAGEIGEPSEEERCAQFLRQLDPAWSPDWTGYPT